MRKMNFIHPGRAKRVRRPFRFSSRKTGFLIRKSVRQTIRTIRKGSRRKSKVTTLRFYCHQFLPRNVTSLIPYVQSRKIIVFRPLWDGNLTVSTTTGKARNSHSPSEVLRFNQDSGSVVSFRIDSDTGKLQPTGFTAVIPNPVCVKFLTGNSEQHSSTFPLPLDKG
jgi:hypothetical protein